MKKIYLVLFVILSVFVFSCKDNLISDDLSSNQNSGAGQVKVFVKQSRLIGPDVSDVDWTVELRKSGENNTISGKNENGYYLFSGLSDGTYNIKVSGKIDEVEKFTGSAQVTITNGNSVSVNVPIVATKNLDAEVQSTGYATITMDMSGKLLSLLNSMDKQLYFEAYLSTDLNENGNVIASLVEITYDEQGNPFIEFLDNKKVEFQFMDPDYKTNSPEIPTGYYYLTFSGLEMLNYTIKLKDNLVEIGDGLTTNIVLTQNDYELVQGNVQYLDRPTVFYINNSNNDHVYNSEYIGNVTSYAGLSLFNPLGFTNINSNISGTLYLISDVEAYKEDEENGSKSFPGIGDSGSTITSFGTDIFSITNNISDSFVSFNLTTLKNIKLTNTTGTGFILSDSTIDGTVILDTPIAKNLNSDSVVNLDKSSKLVIGQNFSGELGIRLSPENWQLGDTVVTFENGVKPSNSNFYISESYDSQGNSLDSKFYIDDNGKLAQYDVTSQWVNFAWNSRVPCLITQTQAKNKTYTRIIDSTGRDLNGFNGISTYDENGTWYFIANGYDSSGYTVTSLYKVSASTEYTDTVSPEKIEVSIPDSPAGVNLPSVTAMDYDNGKLYMGFYETELFPFYVIDTASNNCSSASVSLNHIPVDKLTALLVDGDNVYIATTLTDTTQQNVSTTHSAIWQLTLEQTENGYILSPAQTYNDATGATNPVPYYLTQYDDMLTINNSFPENSTFRITDLYSSEDGSIYGLLANYIEKEGEGSVGNDVNKSFMRGSVFKLEQNTAQQDNPSDPIMNATHLGLRNSFPLTLENLATAKQYFILPRKIVGILNKKLVIVDDGMVPDSNGCNVDRFVLFDLAGEISETIDVGISFTTQASVSMNKYFFTTGTLFESPEY